MVFTLPWLCKAVSPYESWFDAGSGSGSCDSCYTEQQCCAGSCIQKLDVCCPNSPQGYCVMTNICCPSSVVDGSTCVSDVVRVGNACCGEGSLCADQSTCTNGVCTVGGGDSGGDGKISKLQYCPFDARIRNAAAVCAPPFCTRRQFAVLLWRRHWRSCRNWFRCDSASSTYA